MGDGLRIHVSKIVQAKRLAAGLTLADVAKRTGIELNLLVEYEADSTNMNIRELELIADAIGTGVLEFFEGYPLAVATKIGK